MKLPQIDFSEDAVDTCALVISSIENTTVVVWPAGGSFPVEGELLGYDEEDVTRIRVLVKGRERIIRARKITVM